MGVSFVELLMNPEYSPMAQGWPTFEAVDIQTINGQLHPAVGGYDFISKYRLPYELLTSASHTALREFFVLRQCLRQGFRFKAPDHNSMVLEEIATIVDGTVLYPIYEKYTDTGNTYLRRIMKISADTVTVRIHTTDVLITPTAWNDAAHTLPSQGAGTFSGAAVDFDYNSGRVEIAGATATSQNGRSLKVSCGFHLPVVITGNPSAKHESTYSAVDDFNLTEILPISLGITD